MSFLAQLLRPFTASSRQSPRISTSRPQRSCYFEDSIPYGKPVQVICNFMRERSIGEIGTVLTKQEHGITDHGAWVTLDPSFPGIRGVDVFVRFSNSKDPELWSLFDLALAR